MTMILPSRNTTHATRVRPALVEVDNDMPTTLSITLSSDSMHQLLLAFNAAGADEGYESIDDLLAEAINKETLRLQRNYFDAAWND